MKKSCELDLSALRTSLLWLLGAVIVASLLIASSLHFRAAMENEKRAQDSRLQALVRNYQDLVEAERIIETLFGRYRKLEARGFIGEEPRLQWLETLRRMGEENGILAMEYRLHEQRPYSLPPAVDSGSYQVYASAMDLQVDALHEGDLLLFLDHLHGQESGLVVVDGCTLRRQGGDEVLPGAANVRAACKLSWFSIRVQDDDAMGGEEFM